MAKDLLDADVVHCHTWYTHLAGCWQAAHRGGLVLTTHSLEPHRPWKVEQLGTAYHASSWVERTAYENADGVIAVSESMREDVHAPLRRPPRRSGSSTTGSTWTSTGRRPTPPSCDRYGIDPDRPFVLFVGRITRQKGIIHLVNAIKDIRPASRSSSAPGPRTRRRSAARWPSGVEQARREPRSPIIWIPQIVPKEEIIPLYTHAALFVCPSVYEPFGIINLEAMACETPVVASAVGGITEVVVPGETGFLVNPHLRPGTFDPADPAAFSAGLAEAINRLIRDPELRHQLGAQGRKRAVAHFSWDSIAEQTIVT